MKEFVLRLLHVMVYAFELLYHKSKHKHEEKESEIAESEDNNNECNK